MESRITGNKLKSIISIPILTVLIMMHLSNTALASESKYGIDMDSVMKTESAIKDEKGLAFIHQYKNGRIEETQTTMTDFVAQHKIKIIIDLNNEKVFYSLADTAKEHNLEIDCDNIIEALRENDGKLEIAYNKSKATLTREMIGGNDRIACIVENGNTKLFSGITYNNFKVYENELYIGQDIYELITDGLGQKPEYDIRINKENLYVFDRKNSEIAENSLMGMLESEKVATIQSLFMLHKHCPDIYEKIATIKSIEKDDGTNTSSKENNIEIGGVLAYTIPQENRVWIAKSSLFDSCDELASIIAHESEHIEHYRKTGKCPEQSAVEQQLVVLRAFGKTEEHLYEIIESMYECYSQNQWFKG